MKLLMLIAIDKATGTQPTSFVGTTGDLALHHITSIPAFAGLTWACVEGSPRIFDLATRITTSVETT